MKNIVIILLLFFLSGCGYSSKFNCPESKGAWCMSLSKVDQMIDSGEIVEYHQNKNGQCLFASCSGDKKIFVNQPPMAQKKVMVVKINEAKEQEEQIKILNESSNDSYVE